MFLGDLLQLLAEVLSNMMSGHPSKTPLVRWFERAVMAVVVALIALVIYDMYAS